VMTFTSDPVEFARPPRSDTLPLRAFGPPLAGSVPCGQPVFLVLQLLPPPSDAYPGRQRQGRPPRWLPASTYRVWTVDDIVTMMDPEAARIG
jgi:hypothetical protein